MARVNINILGINELKWTRMAEFNSDDHYIYYFGQESLRRNGVALLVNKRVQNAVRGCSLKNNRMISVRFQGKPFNITIIQVYAPITNAQEAEVKWFLMTHKTLNLHNFICQLYLKLENNFKIQMSIENIRKCSWDSSLSMFKVIESICSSSVPVVQSVFYISVCIFWVLSQMDMHFYIF